MKQLLTIALAITCMNASAQKTNKFMIRERRDAPVTIKGDTVIVSGLDIRFIKVDGVVYQLKRVTTLEKVEPTLTIEDGWFRTSPLMKLYNGDNMLNLNPR